ncbi:MAG: hypothetical protein OMM_05382 [Candidatus Magnetoglobus multicellularis str. Araruama]|uniref:Cadherin domain-containing protein n=1 Tax=Candidatus Magnetoglobus multicellularis str. Araruama TaxID=890399 RepID=A0A1V1NWX0_9BACT|nr:MAG: hypothetical protein OMM_05382 [Candidatus Magnetoglobus multicellularis str. Araruama]
MWGLEKTFSSWELVTLRPDKSACFNVCSNLLLKGIPDWSVGEDYSVTVPISFINETDAPYTISAHALNPLLVIENEQQVYHNDYELEITPRPDQHGKTNIIIVAEDSNGEVASTEFILTVDPIPDAPELLSTIPQQITISQGTPYTSPVFYIKDVDTEPSNLSIRVTSSNHRLLPDDDIDYNCNYDNCYLTIPPISEYGTTEIELTLSDPTGFTSVASFACVIPEPKYLTICLVPDNVYTSIGEAVSISVMYDVSDKNTTLDDLGIRIHYDSTILTYLNATNHAPSYLGSSDQAEDPEHLDNDSNTDRLITFEWADINQNWPNKNLPCILVDLAFEVKSGITSNNTSINTGFTSLADEYEGQSENTTLYIDTRQAPELSFYASELTLLHMAQTMFTVSDADSDYLTIVAFSSDQMLVPDAFINLGHSDSNYITVRSSAHVPLSLTCYQADKNYGQAIITVEAYDDTGLSASQQISVSVSPFHSLTCENCEITQTMGMVAAGSSHYLVLKPNGRVMAGRVGYYGYPRTPLLIQGLSNIVSIQSGSSHNLALRSDGTVWSWGFNGNGELGDGSRIDQSLPVQILPLNNIVGIAAGDHHCLALQADGTVWAWGDLLL